VNNSEIKALITLLDDTDSSVYSTVGDKILSIGKEIIPFLETEWETSFSPIVQERIENLIHLINLSTVKNKLYEWKNSSKQDLLEGAFIVASYQYPDLDKDELEADICQLYYELWSHITEGMSTIDKIKSINHVFFQQQKYSPNTKNFHSPKNSYINLVMETKKGNPITLCIIYLLITQRMGLSIYGVNLPNLFVLTYKDSEQQFYINVFNRGLIFSREDVETYIGQLNKTPKEEYFSPCGNLDIIIRMINTLIISYQKLNDEEKVIELQELLTILTLD